MDDTEAVLRLGGMTLAHAAWSIEDGSTLCTLAVVEVDGERELVRYEADTIDESQAGAHADLRDRLRGAGIAAFVYDGYITPQGGQRTDALIMELLGPDTRALGMVVQPYQPGRRSRLPFLGRPTGFRIIGTPIISDAVAIPDPEKLVFEGTQDHPKAAHFFLDAQDEQ